MESPQQIRVVLVDDHPATRAGLSMFVRTYPDLELVGEFADGNDVLMACDQLQPDVVLVDLRLQDQSGIDVIRAGKRRHPKIQFIALTSYVDPTSVQDALRAGAISYLLKDIGADELAHAIRAAYAGHSILAEEAAQAPVQGVRAGDWPDPSLTDREREVLGLLAYGLSNASIADELSVSRATAKYHVRHILAKFGFANRSEAVAMAWQLGIVADRPGGSPEHGSDKSASR